MAQCLVILVAQRDALDIAASEGYVSQEEIDAWNAKLTEAERRGLELYDRLVDDQIESIKATTNGGLH